MSYIKKLASQTVYYGISSVMGRMIYFLIIPFQTRKLSFQELGTISELYAIIALLNILSHLNIDIAFFRFTDKKNQRKIFSSSFFVLLLSNLIWSCLLIFFSTRLMTLIGHPGKEIYVYLSLCIIVLDSITLLPLAYYRQNNLLQNFIIIQLTKTISLLVLNVFVLYFLKYFLPFYSPQKKIEYLLIANILSSLFGFLLSLKVFYKIKFDIDFGLISKILKFSVPLALVSLLGVFNDMFIRISIKYFLPQNFYPGYNNNEILGLFSSCFKLALIMNLFVQSFRYAAEPFFLTEAKKFNYEEKFIKILDYFIFGGLIFWFFISINIDLISYVMLSPKVQKCTNIIPFAMLSYFFYGVYFNISSWFKIANKTYVALFFYISCFIVSFTSLYLLLPKLGYWSNIVAMNIGSITMVILCYLFGQKFKPINYNIKKNLIFLAVFFFSFLIYVKVTLNMAFLAKVTLGLSMSFLLSVAILKKRLYFKKILE